MLCFTGGLKSKVVVIWHLLEWMLCFSFFSEKCKARGFTVIVDGRKSQWNVVKTVVLMLQVNKYLYIHS